MLHELFKIGDVGMFDDEPLPVGFCGSDVKTEGGCNFKTNRHGLGGCCCVGGVPGGDAVFGGGDDEAEPFEAFEVFGDGIEFLLG